MNHRSLDGNEKPPLDDDALHKLIWEGFDADPVFQFARDGRARIEVEVDGGEVILNGVVRTALDRRKADILARALGATTVDNRLRIEPEDPAGISQGGQSVPGARARGGRRRLRLIVDGATGSASGEGPSRDRKQEGTS
jgi:BON domain